jgi:hypothetical protein
MESCDDLKNNLIYQNFKIKYELPFLFFFYYFPIIEKGN